MSDIVAFISYSHDSDSHRERVLRLSERLRQNGIETILDRYVPGSPSEGWPRWMLNGLDRATHVLCICTETYYRRFRGHQTPGIGKGVDWEGAIITQEIYHQRHTTTRFIPVLFDTADEASIPEPLRGQTRYVINSDPAYEGLYDALLGQSGVEPGPIGSLRRKPRLTASSLTFPSEPTHVSATSAPLSGTASQTTTANFPQPLSHDISRVTKYAPEKLIGREPELQLIDDAWQKAVRGESARPRVLTFVALGGEGKTSLIARWAADLEYHGWPNCEAAFAWSFYSQGANEQMAASSDLFLKEALIFFGDRETAESPASNIEKGRRLASLVGHRPAILILDGVEPLQYPPGPMDGRLKDDGIAQLLTRLAAHNRGFCVVTTRYKIADLHPHSKTAAPTHDLPRLPRAAGVQLLQSLGVIGSTHRASLTGSFSAVGLNEYEKVVEDVKGHALTLSLLGSYLRDAHAGDIRKRDLVKLEDADAEERGGHAFRVIDAYVRWFQNEGDYGHRAIAVLRMLGLFDRPATADLLNALRKPPVIHGVTKALVGLNESEWNITLSRLKRAGLVSPQRDAAGALISLDAHPLVREYFASERKSRHPEAWRSAHQRLFEYLSLTNADQKSTPTLEDLQPLYQAVAHGCRARLLRTALHDVYIRRILRGLQNYSWKMLGANGSNLAAVASFFENPWKQVRSGLSRSEEAWLLNEASIYLRALGRLTEAVDPMRSSGDMDREASNWINAATSFSNLSELNVMLGDIPAAIRNGEESFDYAHRSGERAQVYVSLAVWGDAVHQSGKCREALALFTQAERLQAASEPAHPLLYSVRGFRFCEVLMANLERTSWQRMLGLSAQAELDSHLEDLRSISGRAEAQPERAQSGVGLLDLALFGLLRARIEIHTAILADDADHSRLGLLIGPNDLVAKFREAGQTFETSRSLMTRAWILALRGSDGDADRAHADLDEAFDFAGRGPMPLLMADIHLHRARLFFRESVYPWNQNPDGTPRTAKDDLGEARRLIEKHGYWRRKEELEDAEVALGINAP